MSIETTGDALGGEIKPTIFGIMPVAVSTDCDQAYAGSPAPEDRIINLDPLEFVDSRRPHPVIFRLISGRLVFIRNGRSGFKVKLIAGIDLNYDREVGRRGPKISIDFFEHGGPETLSLPLFIETVVFPRLTRRCGETEIELTQSHIYNLALRGNIIRYSSTRGEFRLC